MKLAHGVCYSTLGSNVSAIGAAVNTTLNPRTWVDNGMVVESGHATDFNAIDPCVFEDAQHGVWLSFGSYFSGIKLIAIDAATGRQASTRPTLYSLAFRPGARAEEASAITYHTDYYHLFVNWGACCQGTQSTYAIRLGRSQSVTGPYVDKTGKEMLAGGGTLFLGSVPDNGMGNLCDDAVGPGHIGILHDTDGDWVSFHEEWARDRNGATTVNLLKLAWDSDGWPRAVLDPGPYKIVSGLTTHDLLTPAAPAARDGAFVQTWPVEGGSAQKWRLAYQGDGYYSIRPVVSGKALTVLDKMAAPGAKAGIAQLEKRDNQLWLLRQNDNGMYTLLPKSGGQAVALDIGGCNPSDGVPVGLWNVNGLVCQQWSFHTR